MPASVRPGGTASVDGVGFPPSHERARPVAHGPAQPPEVDHGTRSASADARSQRTRGTSASGTTSTLTGRYMCSCVLSLGVCARPRPACRSGVRSTATRAAIASVRPGLPSGSITTSSHARSATGSASSRRAAQADPLSARSENVLDPTTSPHGAPCPRRRSPSTAPSCCAARAVRRPGQRPVVSL